MIKHLGVTVCTAVLAVCGCAEGGELTRSSLAGVSRLGALIVTVANDTVPENDVRRAVERRLAQAKITIDGDPGPELQVSVSSERRRAERGACECGTFRVTVRVREAVVLERAPEQGPVAAITWQTGGAARVLSVTAPRLAIMDALEECLSAFVREVSSDTQQAEKEQK